MRIPTGVMLVMLLLVSLACAANAQKATQDEALTVANNWIVRVIEQEGRWGDSEWADVLSVEPFMRGDLLLGFFCRVEPGGFILVSLYEELAPIKAYSTESNLDPDVDEGMTDLLKMKMQGILDALQVPSGSLLAASSPNVQGPREIDYRPAWRTLMGGSESITGHHQSLRIAADYQAGQAPLLSSRWHQEAPYNSLCPPSDSVCASGGALTVVGCLATAAAQIMKYWNWPPYGEGSHSYVWRGDRSCPTSRANAGGQTLSATFGDRYDWLQMPDTLTLESGAGMIDATAELCYETGVAIEMDYGLWGSGPWEPNMPDAYVNHFRYSSKCQIWPRLHPIRGIRDQDDWFDTIKGQLGMNRPMQYGVGGHSMVLDGWREESIGGVLTRQYHMNYGWAGAKPRPGNDAYCPEWDVHASSNAWYTLDELPCSEVDDEDLVLNIYPAVALDAELTPNQILECEPPNYRYFAVDTKGRNVAFEPGQNLQFLPKVKVECTGDHIDFSATTASKTRLFSIRGTEAAEIRMIKDSALRLYAGGGIRFHGTR